MTEAASCCVTMLVFLPNCGGGVVSLISQHCLWRSLASSILPMYTKLTIKQQQQQQQHLVFLSPFCLLVFWDSHPQSEQFAIEQQARCWTFRFWRQLVIFVCTVRSDHPSISHRRCLSDDGWTLRRASFTIKSSTFLLPTFLQSVGERNYSDDALALLIDVFNKRQLITGRSAGVVLFRRWRHEYWPRFLRSGIVGFLALRWPSDPLRDPDTTICNYDG